MAPLRRCVGAVYLLTIVADAYSGSWTPVDVLPWVCNQAPALIMVNMSEFGSLQYSPHVITMMRTSGSVVSMSISAEDGAGTVVLPKTAITLQAINGMGGRRLEEEAKPPVGEEPQRPIEEADLLEDEDPEDAWMLEEDGDLHELDGEDDLDEKEIVPTRRLLSDREEREEKGRLLAKGGGRSRKTYSSSSKSTVSTPKYSLSDPRSYQDARRRANPATARRRGAPDPTGLRRRQTGVDGTRFDNPSNPSAGAYGYTSTGTVNQNFPGGHSQTSYGYTGPNAHSSSSTNKILMGAAAGGTLGFGAGYMYSNYNNYDYSSSRWNRGGWGWRNQNCQSGSWSGSCDECYRSYSNCQLFVDRNAGRDDLMLTGFIPFGYTDPLVFKIEDIVGQDYQNSTICPPAGWSPDSTGTQWTNQPATFQDIWMTFTPVEELAEALGADASGVNSVSPMSLSLVFLGGVRLLLGLLNEK